MDGARPCIAVVDDEESILKALERLLRVAGFDVKTFNSGADFISSLAVRLPDCVVLDLHMPRLNGFAVQEQLLASGKRVPVVVITGHDTPEAKQRVLQNGAAAYLRKPVDEKLLLRAIEDATAIRSES